MGLLCIGWNDRLLILARFYLIAVFRRKDVFALQVFRGVDVLGFFLLAFLARAFLARRFGNALVLGAALRCTKESEGRNQKRRHTAMEGAEGGLCGSQAAEPRWSVKIRAGHSNRPLTGDNA